jgi:hypothetical protein
MAKIAKSDVVVGLLCASARYPDVRVLGWFNKSRGIARCEVFNWRGEPIEVTLPWQSLRY